MPNTVSITLRTLPPGLQVTLDGQPVATQATITSVVGIARTLGVVSPQSVAPSVCYFRYWSDGGAAAHTITTPVAAATYEAVYSTDPRPPSNLRIVQ